MTLTEAEARELFADFRTTEELNRFMTMRLAGADKYARDMAWYVYHHLQDWDSEHRFKYTNGSEYDCRHEMVEKIRLDHQKLMEYYESGALNDNLSAPVPGVWPGMAQAFADKLTGAEATLKQYRGEAVTVGPRWAPTMHYLFCSHLQEYMPAALLSLPVKPYWHNLDDSNR